MTSLDSAKNTTPPVADPSVEESGSLPSTIPYVLTSSPPDRVSDELKKRLFKSWYDSVCVSQGRDPLTANPWDVLSPAQARRYWKEILGPWSGPFADRPILQSYASIPDDPELLAWAYFPRRCRHAVTNGRGGSRPCGRRWCSLQDFLMRADALSEDTLARLDMNGMLDGGWTYLWMSVKPEAAVFEGLDQLKILRNRIRARLGRLKKTWPLLGAGWVLDWSIPYLGKRSIPHDQWIIAVPPGVDPSDVAKCLADSVARIAARQKIRLAEAVWIEPMNDVVGSVKYISGIKSRAKVTLPPQPLPGKRIRSHDLSGLIPDDVPLDIRDDPEEINGHLYDRLRERRDKCLATRRERDELRRIEHDVGCGGRVFARVFPQSTDAESVRGILAAFQPSSLLRYDRGVAREISATEAVNRAMAEKVHDVGPAYARYRRPYIGEPIVGCPAKFVLALNINIYDDVGERAFERLVALLRTHANRPVFVRMSGGVTGVHWHRHIFVIGLDSVSRAAWVQVIEAMQREPGCGGFEIVTGWIRVPLSPSYWRKETVRQHRGGDGVYFSHDVDDDLISIWAFDYVGFSEAARYYAADPARCEGAGLPPDGLLHESLLANLNSRRAALEAKLDGLSGLGIGLLPGQKAALGREIDCLRKQLAEVEAALVEAQGTRNVHGLLIE